jgi:hypothetical protein
MHLPTKAKVERLQLQVQEISSIKMKRRRRRRRLKIKEGRKEGRRSLAPSSALVRDGGGRGI